VPAWVLNRWKSRMGISGIPGVTETHLLVVAGQSNSTQVEVYPTAPREAHPRVFQRYGGAIRNLPGDAVYIGSEAARAYADANPQAVVVIVDCGVGALGSRQLRCRARLHPPRRDGLPITSQRAAPGTAP
jgi:hypothetical protein